MGRVNAEPYLNPKPYTLIPKPQTPNPDIQPQTSNLKPQTLNPEPGTDAPMGLANYLCVDGPALAVEKALSLNPKP